MDAQKYPVDAAYRSSMNIRILGVNGIRSNGSQNTDLLLNDLKQRGYDTVDVSYPRVNIFTARSRKRQLKNAQHIIDAYQPGDAIFAHSYGCLLVLRAMELGARFSHVFFFGAAMNDDFTFPAEGMLELDNFHNPHDIALTFGKLLWWHDFGGMGQTGYAGPPDARITNFDLPYQQNGFFSLNHSHYFSDDLRPVHTDYIDEILKEFKK